MDEESLKRLPADFKAKFSVVEKVLQNEVRFELPPKSGNVTTTQTDRLHGFRFEAAGGRSVVLFEQMQFVVSHVGHYESWESLIAEAKQAWEAFRAVAQPIEIGRVGLRYINKCKLQLPAESNELLTAGPSLPEELDLNISAFLSQVTVPLPIDATANVTQVLQHEVDSSYAIIDVDVFRQGLALDPGSDEPWTKLESFREWKNRLFFSLVTNKLLEQYS